MYEWIRRTREVIFRYCESLPVAVYRQSLPAFGPESIRDLHVHAAQCYLAWLGRFAMGEEVAEPDGEDVAATRRLFARADDAVERFLGRFWAFPDRPLQGTVSWRAEPLTVTPRWLLTHAVTHEFHHKGQMVKLGRLLGHPVATDADLALPDDLDDLGRLARRTGLPPEAAAREALAAALARTLAPEVGPEALAARMHSPVVERAGLQLAAEAAKEIDAYPAALQPAIAAALAAIARDPGLGQEAGGRRRYGFAALGAEWRAIYAVADRVRVLAVTTRERAGR
jgi:uncharacterized damage-inducible protein DinB